MKTENCRWRADRRVYVMLCLVFIVLCTELIFGVKNLHAQTRPNVILIVTDDQRWDTLQYMPAVEKELIQNGVTFTDAFVTTPLCCPSRASLLTGQYAHNHGVYSNSPPTGSISRFNDSSTLATWIQKAGYKTAMVGKYLNGYGGIPNYIPPGWNDWQALLWLFNGYYNYGINENGAIVFYGTGDDNYSTDVLADKAVDFIRKSSKKPFFLYFAPYAPHFPSQPASRHKGYFDGIQPWRPVNYNEEDVSDKPEWVRDIPPMNSIWDVWVDIFRKKQLESLQAVDEAVASIVYALKETGKYDNTVIILVGDHGLTWGEHRWKQKNCVYEECIRVPLVVFYPGLSAAQRQDNRLVLNIDMAPTIAELAGIPVPSDVDGMSIVPLIFGTETVWRQDFLVEHWPDNLDPIPPEFGAVRNNEWKYIEYITGERELYSLVNDPYELNNIINNESNSTVIALLEHRLQELKAAGAGNLPLIINNASLPEGTLGETYNTIIRVSGGMSPYSWKHLAGYLPEGIYLDSSTGELMGVPMSVGTYTFTVSATDAMGQWDITVLSITIAP